jgi:serine/threonine-protein kinase RsbW
MRSSPDDGRAFSLRIERSVAGLEQLAGWVDEVAAALRLAPATEYALRLCLEEAAANVVMHGVADAGGPQDGISLRVTPDADVLCVAIEDRCGAFNPLEVPAPERPRSLDETRVGGVGIHLMRQYACSISYERVAGMNRLQLSLERGLRRDGGP